LQNYSASLVKGSDTLGPLAEVEAKAYDAVIRYIAASHSDDLESRTKSYIELSSSVSDLYAVYLEDKGWSDGWLDGIPFYTFNEISEDSVRYSGLLVWGDDRGDFWLGPFHAIFRLAKSGAYLGDYQLFFKSDRKDRQPIRYVREKNRVSQQIAIPDTQESINEAEWLYVFSSKCEVN
jgi:hypothetical protein